MTPTSARIGSLARRVDELDWNHAAGALDDVGIAATGTVLTADECRLLDLRELLTEHAAARRPGL